MSIVGAIFRCKNCDWSTQDFLHGVNRAKDHAQAMGHVVDGEVTRYYTFKPKTARQLNPLRRKGQP